MSSGHKKSGGPFEGCDCKLLNPLTDINGIRVLSRLGRPTRSSRAPTDMIPTRAPSRAPFTVAVGITSGPRTCSRAPVGSKTRRRDMPGGTVSTFAQKFLQNTPCAGDADYDRICVFTVNTYYEGKEQFFAHWRDRRRNVVHHRVRRGLHRLELQLLHDQGREAAQDQAAVQVPEPGRQGQAEAPPHSRGARPAGSQADRERQAARETRGRIQGADDGRVDRASKKTAGEG